MEREGDEIPAETFKGSMVAYEDDRATLYRDGEVFRRGIVTLDPAKSPKRINTWDLGGPYEDQTVPGIYEIDGDTLKICFSRPGIERPTEFTTKKASGLPLLRLQAEKAVTTPAHDTIGGYLTEHEPVLVLWHHLAELVGGDDTRASSLEGLTLPAATIYLVGVFEGQVVQGGFRQFLRAHSGDHAQDTLQALREVGAHVSVELLEKALTVFPEGVAPTDREERVMRIDQADLADPAFFDAFDELYNSHVDSQSPHRVEKIDALLLDYMKEHADVRLTY